MKPYDYSIDTASPLESYNEGLKSGAAQQQLQQQQVLKNQEMQRKVDLQKDLAALGSTPTPQGIAALSGKYPELSEHWKKSYDMLSSEQQQSKVSAMTPVYAAALNGDTETASKKLLEHATALENSGKEQEAAQTKAMAQYVKDHPEQALRTTGILLSQAMGADKFISTFSGLQKDKREAALEQPELDKATAEARKATTEADLLPQVTSEKIKTEQTNRQIAALDVQIKQANSETERSKLLLEKEKLQLEKDKALTGKAEESQNKLDNATTALETVKAIRNHPGLKSVGTITGKISAMIPGSERKDFEGLVTTLKSQQFLTNIQQMKGTGAISEAEGKKLDSAIASVDLDMSTKGFNNALGVIEAILKKGQTRELDSGRAPSSGGAFVVKHPTFGVIKEGDINRLQAKNPGATREQIIQYLTTTGAK